MITKIGVAGAGTMGSGIALSAALSGIPVILFDTNEEVLTQARSAIQSNLTFLEEKGKINSEEKKAALHNVQFTSDINRCKADMIIEAIIEKPDAKVALFTSLDEINKSECIFASNTSSLSISAIQKNIAHPDRVAGMHFFNPAHVMKLVEVVKGEHTSQVTTGAIVELCKRMKKTPVICIDSPGFIVNRVARPYYLEAMKIVESGLATFEGVDEIMEASGFKMGPFKLMDLIGIDINYAVSTSLYNALEMPERLKPSTMQTDKIQNNQLGKKTGRGFYSYTKQAPQSST